MLGIGAGIRKTKRKKKQYTYQARNARLAGELPKDKEHYFIKILQRKTNFCSILLEDIQSNDVYNL
jgi:hypothetical protein